MKDLFYEASTALRNGVPFVYCLVTHTSGSTPRKAGSRMLVFGNGVICGTIGGGSIEYQVMQEAESLLNGGEPMHKNYHLEEDLNMQCGGTMQVYIEPVGCFPKVYIFGAGHIGKALCEICPRLGFRPIIIDHRDGIFNSWSIPVITTYQMDYLEAVETLGIDSKSFIVIVTPKHEFDEKILFQVTKKNWTYCGMIGSKRKVAVIRKKAIEENLVSLDVLNRIDMPIGIPIAAETPEEIAISIVARLIDVKNKKIESSK